jgi:hypothetical protein
MNATLSQIFMQRWNVVQHELIPHLGNEIGQLTPRLEKLIHVLEWIRIEEWTAVSWWKTGHSFGPFYSTNANFETALWFKMYLVPARKPLFFKKILP